MEFQQLEHLIEASAAIVNKNVVIIFGSASLLASLPKIPPEFASFTEAEIFLPEAP